MERKIIVLVGAPGSGKGTQASLLKEKINLPTVSIGTLLRGEMKKNIKLRNEVTKKISEGELVDSKIIEKIILKIIVKQEFKKGFIFDGYPRTKEQVDYLMNKIVKKEDKLLAVFINLSNKEIKSRLTGRRSCACGESYHIKYKKPIKRGICDKCGLKLTQREDDNPKSVINRIKVFHKESQPIIDYFKENNLLVEVSGDAQIKKIHSDIIKMIKHKK